MITDLLTNDFITHYHLPAVPTIKVIQLQHTSFGISDLKGQGITITPTHLGTAVCTNPQKHNITIIGYESFINTIANEAFQKNKNRCDILCETTQTFVLGELKETKTRALKEARKKAKTQLITSLQTLCAVPAIKKYLETKTIRKCCFFHKKPTNVANIYAPEAFNRLATLPSVAIKKNYPDIEAFGFECYEYTYPQVLTLS
ncbi:hypothetical protein SAMN05444369_102186 [Capnocytophaga haemolytica]|uniref:Uncharacterized protein n=1 Tax=Capnocytophaga haemolytica TaxID=45243 RepID=A0AAX2GWH7_9FLAO|nr:hypothetical protein [Capnocytophaga haemolytica]AMD84874.1 hypothetical protein AXF12_04695 [Capnocytophaga haemolytica]SFN76927.1 hypothetical protein SAMN05444369_102186 [Capnocytophaga haemolytica]SNV06724.1 Uncharacterised protein [Capnocytophaga haemolytica]